MVRDNRRIAAPENCLSSNNFKAKSQLESLIQNDARNDGRAPSELKSISLQVGIVPSVTGSAYLESGKTKIICSVNGPRDVLTKSDSSVKGQLYCEFKYAMFSGKERQPYLPTDEETSISRSIQDALEPVILLHKFPKSRLDIAILVLENDGGVVSAAITCAGAALSNAGVEMYDLPIGCSLVHYDSTVLVDPTAEEELYCKSKEECKYMAIAMMVEYKNQVIYMDSFGYINPVVLSESLKILQSSCHQILTDIRLCLMQHVEDMRDHQDDIPTDGAISKKAEAQLKLLQPQKYINTFLEHDLRPGGRLLTNFRSVLINTGSIGTACGSALVKIGDTSVLCGIKAELTNPLSNKPDEGFFVPNVTLTSVCSNRYVPGPPTEQAQVYSQIIMDLWKNSPFVDPTDLCITPNKLSWCLFAEMVCLSFDGNVLDACILALMAALRNTKLPEVVVNEETNSIEVTDKLIDLKVSYFVFSATYAVLEKSCVADPSAEEESLAKSGITVFLKDKHEINVHSFGPVKEDQLFHCIDCSKERYSEMKALLETLN
ncbi:Exosome complex component RRP43 [Araneus ventricosus]|uniref:Ribosomal RNA-processing protein 43 n=1 Tax=Araneus ventricosus TaxID=182803 RepID=A0A4Y2LM85_ARAVE|nr:Exosome complex component RRP43 [Araneus ventricosus]